MSVTLALQSAAWHKVVLSIQTGLVVQVKETVRDVKLLHNEQFFAAAQKKYVYIYDKRGLEVHCLKVRRALTTLHTGNATCCGHWPKGGSYHC